jgi:prolyl 4-hydroxylase
LSIVEGFLPATEAMALRAAFEAHLAAGGADGEVWRYEHSKGLRTRLSTAPEKVLGRERVEAFHRALSDWAREALGTDEVGWPSLTLHVGGCGEAVAGQPGGGVIYAYSLTPDGRTSAGGETVLVAGGACERIAPAFNRLVLFDAPLPHGVERVDGPLDPAEGRLVLHGRIGAGAAMPAGAAPDAALRARAAGPVRVRLKSNAGLVQLATEGLEMFLGRSLLDAGECAGLMALIDAGRQPSGLLSPTADPDFRTSESCNLDPAHPLVRQVEAKIAALTGIEPRFGETIQGQRYAVGQQFKPHHDFFHTDQPYWQTQKNIGGQRTWTLMVFLNEPEAGGETNFPEAGVRIAPRAGSVLIWNNLDSEGEPNRRSLHQGMPVEAGLKYVITKWYRERPWG